MPHAHVPEPSPSSPLPPFPPSLKTAPILSISSSLLLSHSPAESTRVLQACQTHGFFYLDLRDSTPGRTLLAQAEELLALSKRVCTGLSREEKERYLRRGSNIFGWKAPGSIKATDREKRPDTTEFWNLAKDWMFGFAPPPPARPAQDDHEDKADGVDNNEKNPYAHLYPPEIWASAPLVRDFQTRAHSLGLQVLRVLAEQLGLETEVFCDLNVFSKPSQDHIRLTRKEGSPLGEDEEAGRKTVGIPRGGNSHTDFGSVTVLFNWLGGLQVEPAWSSSADDDGQKKMEWEWVKPVEGHAIINLGDAMTTFTNGHLKSAKHRVVPAPGEQAKLDRYSVVYFVRPNNAALMKPVDAFAGTGPLVKVAGKFLASEEGGDGKVWTAEEWMAKRTMQLLEGGK